MQFTALAAMTTCIRLPTAVHRIERSLPLQRQLIVGRLNNHVCRYAVDRLERSLPHRLQFTALAVIHTLTAVHRI